MTGKHYQTPWVSLSVQSSNTTDVLINPNGVTYPFVEQLYQGRIYGSW